MASFPDNGDYGLSAQFPITGTLKLDGLATSGADGAGHWKVIYVQVHYSKI